jgi:hypothetical protein
MSSLCVVLGLAIYIYIYIYICNVAITCSFQAYGAHVMQPLNAISELVRHMPCPQVSFVLYCITLCYFILLCIRLQ